MIHLVLATSRTGTAVALRTVADPGAEIAITVSALKREDEGDRSS